MHSTNRSLNEDEAIGLKLTRKPGANSPSSSASASNWTSFSAAGGAAPLRCALMGRQPLRIATLAIQSVLFGAYIVITDEKKNLEKLFNSWKKGLPVGFFGCLATFCWFYAFSLVDATLVRAVGQLEIVFSVLMSYIFYKERITGFELIGMSLITISILALLGFPVLN